MTVKEVFEQAREAAMEIRRIEEEAEVRKSQVGVQGHGYDIHSKSGIRDPMRHVVELIDWQREQVDTAELLPPIDYAWEVVRGIQKITDDTTVEMVVRYYLQAESWNSIARIMEERSDILKGHKRSDQVEILQASMDGCLTEWNRIGLAHLREMGSG